MVTKKAIQFYTGVHSDYTKESVIKALRAVERKQGVLDQITVNYYLSEKRFSGLGMGKKKRRR